VPAVALALIMVFPQIVLRLPHPFGYGVK